MGAGSSSSTAAEQPSPQDQDAAAAAAAGGESQPGSPEAETPTLLEEPAKILHKNGQISSINGITEEQVELSLKPEELNGQQAEGTVTDVGQRETPNVILKEEPAENMESKPLESTDKTNEDGEQKDSPDGDKQLPSPKEKEEEQGQPSESPSNDVGFKKVFKFVGFKFTVRKDKAEKSESVQLLNVKSDDSQVALDGTGDHKEVKLEPAEETVQSEVPHPIEKTEQETQSEQMKTKTSEKAAESPVEPPTEIKEAEVKSNGNKSPESPTSPLTNETASPLRKFFSWAGFRKKTSFRKSKEEEQQEKQEQEQQEEKVAQEEAAIKEQLEKEQAVAEKDVAEVSVEPSEEKVKKDIKEGEALILIDASTETLQEEAVTPSELQSPQKSTENVNKESEICLKKADLASEEKLEPVKECLIEQSTVASSEEKNEIAASLETEVLDEKLDKSEQSFPAPVEEHELNINLNINLKVEIVESKSEPTTPLAAETDEIPTEINADVMKKEDAKIAEKELAAEQLAEVDTEMQRRQAIDEQIKVEETTHEGVNDQITQIEPSSGDAAISKPPEGITSEVELFTSHERARMQGSPLKKLFSSTGLKKLSGKKHKGKREDGKSGETAEQVQQLSDSAESPEEPKGESSASSPEEAIESVEKVIDPGNIPETEEGLTSDMEKKGVTPWASFKKMVTPKKRVRRLSESDKEEELDKVKSATLSSTESAPYEEQEDMKENGEEQKLEKSTEEPKRKVDTSVSWEALICVGSSKKRARKSSSSDEEVGQRLAQEGQKEDEGELNKETAPEVPFSSSQESDQGQGSSSPEQAGSPSEGDGISTWESFKRLVTPRRKSKTKMDDRNEESVTVPALEHSTSEGESSGKEESWVSFKKLMPGRRKKKSDGIPEHAPVQEAGEEMTETTEDDSDVPAVVPLSEYEAAEREKAEAQQAKEDDITKGKTLDQKTERSEGISVTELSNEGLVHAVTVTVVEGERAITSIEERSPSWISAAVTESIDHADEEKQIVQVSETGIVEEAVTKLMPEIKKDISDDTIVSEVELTSEAITAREEASGVEEATEVSCAEETTEMVSAVSRLTDSPDTTEIATPVQEIEESQSNLDLSKHTQKVLQEVAERVKLTDVEAVSKYVSIEKSGEEIIVTEVELSESNLKEEPEEIGIESKASIQSDQSQDEVKESGLKEVLKSDDTYVDMKGSSKEAMDLDWTDKNKVEQKVVERHKEIIEEKSEEEEFVIVTATSEEEPEVKVGDIAGKQEVSLEATGSEHESAETVHEVKMNLKDTVQGGSIKDGAPEESLSVKITREEKPQLSQKREQVSEQIISENKISEVHVQSAVTEVNDQDMAKDSALVLETESTEKVALEACVQNKDTGISLHSVETETHVQKTEPEIQLQKLETEISLVNVKPELHLLDIGAQIDPGKVETEIPVMKVEVEVYKQEAETESHMLKVETNGHTEKAESKSHLDKKVEAETLVEKVEGRKEGVEGKMDAEPATEIAKVKSSTEKVEVEFCSENAEAVVPAEKAHTKVDMDMEAHAEKEEAEVGQRKVAAVASIEQVKLPIQNAEAEVFAKKADAVVHVEALTEELGAKKEADVSAENGEGEAPVEKTTGKADEQAHAEKAKETYTEEGDAKIAKKKAEGEVLVEKVIVDEVKVKSPVMKAEVEASAKQSEGMVEVETPPKQGELKEILQKVATEIHPASKQASLINIPMQREMQDASLSLESKHLEAIVSEVPLKNNLNDAVDQTLTEQRVTQEPVERKLDQISESSLDAVDRTQKDAMSTRLILKSAQAEGMLAEAPESNEPGDDIESKCTEEIVPEIPVPKELVVLPMKNKLEVLKCTDTTSSEDAMQREKEDACTSEAESTEIQVTEDSVKKEALVDYVKKEHGSIELATESNTKETVITPAAKTVVSDASTLEKEGESALLDLEGKEKIIKEISGQIKPFPDTPETIHPPLELLPDIDSCQRRQAPSEKALRIETEKSTNVELACGDVLHAALVQEEIFTKQPEVVTTDIPEVQSYGARKTSVSIAAAAVEEQVISEKVTLTETLAETLQSLLEDTKETLKMVQDVSVAHSALGALGPDTDTISWSKKAESTIEDPALSAVQITKDDLIDKCVQQSESSTKEGEKVTTPEGGLSLTNAEFEKILQSVSIESQSTNIVLKVIQNAVDKMEETEEPESMLKQLNESCLMSLNESEVQKVAPIDQQLPGKDIEEKNKKEIQPSATILMQSAKKTKTSKTEEIPLSSDKYEDGQIWDSKKTDIALESVKQTLQADEQTCPVITIVQEPGDVKKTVKEIKKETSLQEENGKPKLESEVETQKAAVDGIVSRDVSKESLDTDQPKRKDIGAGQTVQITEQVTEQQVHVKRKEECSQPTGFVESHTEQDVNNQECMTCEKSLQLKTELTES